MVRSLSLLLKGRGYQSKRFVSLLERKGAFMLALMLIREDGSPFFLLCSIVISHKTLDHIFFVELPLLMYS
jgi:hypothetical protein